MRATPFRRVTEFLILMRQAIAGNQPIPQFFMKDGKGGGKRARTTGHAHMAFVRKARARKNRRA